MTTPGLPRRTLLAAGLALPLTACAVGGGDEGRRRDGSFRSRAMGGRRIGWTAVWPEGHPAGTRMPMVLSLHGRGGSHTSTFDDLHLDDALDHVVGRRGRPFAVVSVDGTDHSYWHRRRDGTDAAAMIVRELLPTMAKQGLDATRIGVFGWSMGGYGALLLTARHHRLVRAAAVASPALFSSAGATAAGAFDGSADYAAHDVFHHPEWVHGVPLMVACGKSDPFYAATRDFVGRLHPAPTTDFGPGGHTHAYWRSIAARELRFLAHHLP